MVIFFFFGENLKVSGDICDTREWEERKRREMTKKLQKHFQDSRSFLYVPYLCPVLSYVAAQY